MTFHDAIEQAQRWLSNCAVSPPHLLPRPSLDDVAALRLILDRAQHLTQPQAYRSTWPTYGAGLAVGQQSATEGRDTSDCA